MRSASIPKCGYLTSSKKRSADHYGHIPLCSKGGADDYILLERKADPPAHHSRYYLHHSLMPVGSHQSHTCTVSLKKKKNMHAPDLLPMQVNKMNTREALAPCVEMDLLVPGPESWRYECLPPCSRHPIPGKLFNFPVSFYLSAKGSLSSGSLYRQVVAVRW